MVAYTKPQQRKKEESEQLRGERGKIKFIDLGYERWQVVGLWEAIRRQVYDDDDDDDDDEYCNGTLHLTID